MSVWWRRQARDESCGSSSDVALRVRGLTKSFGEHTVVRAVDMTVGRGSLYGLAGPNGAGKSTLLSLMVGLLRPDEGSCSVFGVDVWSDPGSALARLGVLPDGLALPERLTGRELLTYVGRLRGLPEDELGSRIDDLLQLMGLVGAPRTLVIDYSTGMRKKVGLALAMLHAPGLLVLDEPLEAVDPVSAATLKRVLRGYVDAGGTVLFSSHVMPVVEQLCDRVAVLAAGVIVADGRLDDVRGERTLEDAFVDLVSRQGSDAELAWLRP